MILKTLIFLDKNGLITACWNTKSSIMEGEKEIIIIQLIIHYYFNDHVK